MNFWGTQYRLINEKGEWTIQQSKLGLIWRYTLRMEGAIGKPPITFRKAYQAIDRLVEYLSYREVLKHKPKTILIDNYDLKKRVSRAIAEAQGVIDA